MIIGEVKAFVNEMNDRLDDFEYKCCAKLGALTYERAPSDQFMRGMEEIIVVREKLRKMEALFKAALESEAPF